MTTIDDATATPVILLRPASRGATDLSSRPRAALVVRFPGYPEMPEDRLREAVLKGLLRRRWELVSAPAGEFDPPFDPEQQRPTVQLTADGDHARVEVGPEILYEGPLGLAADISGTSWLALAHGVGEVLVLVTAGTRPVTDETEINAAARAGHLVGLPGPLRTL